MSKSILKVCPVCGDSYTTYQGVQIYCSRACNLRRLNADPAHQRTAGVRGGKARGAQMTAAAKTDWYMKQDGLHVHRVVAESVLGRPLRRGEIVHHEDRNKKNNHPANLIVFPTQADHARHHKLDHCGKPCGCPGIRLGEVMPNEAP